jgi:hypothetical protein
VNGKLLSVVGAARLLSNNSRRPSRCEYAGFRILNQPSLVAPVLQLGHYSFQIQFAGQAKELDAVPLDVAGVKEALVAQILMDYAQLPETLDGQSGLRSCSLQ